MSNNQQRFDEKARLKVLEFTKKIQEKYGGSDYTHTEVVAAARKHMKKNDLNEGEFNLFEEYLPQLRSKTTNALDKFKFNTPFSKKLGKVTPANVNMVGRLRLETEEDKKAYGRIRGIARNNKQLHHAVTAQSMVYHGAHHIVNTQYKGRVPPNCSFHPVLAALFLNNIPYVENRILFSNLANMVVDRAANRAPLFEPDCRFLIDLTRSTSEMLCHPKSLMHDLLSRVVMQEKIRDLVLKFRSGIVYHESFLDFLQLIDSCSMSSYDAPNFMYMQDEGAILRKIMEAFCMRPLKIVSAPTMGTMATNFTSRGQLPWGMQPIVERGSICVQIPHPSMSPANGGSIDLLSCFQIPQLISMGGVLQSRQHNLLYTQGTFIFYVNRRVEPVHFSTRMRQQARFVIPQPAGIERLNPAPIDFQTTLPLRRKNYVIKSVVCCTTFDAEQGGHLNSGNTPIKRILGCHTLFSIENYTDGNNGTATDPTTYWSYHPQGALFQNGAPSFILNNSNSTSTEGHAFTKFNTKEEFVEICKTSGTIYVYDLQRD